ncbi:hypothetical protein MNBD_GAMMA25-2097 [hydrothermal vent metagenome]|uniref:Uncharacterized protein n=1 Tax=hydrothermal vent metagenome TaxID=652676 RepID=A0A3B1AZZ6_9ZZZZ
MQPKTGLDEILERLQTAERELQQEVDRLLAEKREQFHYQLRRGKVVFEREVRRWQRQYRTGVRHYLYQTPLLFILSAPVIYGMVIPLLILDLSFTLYQHICFRIYDIPRVRRADYLVIDRQHLAYLNIIEKLNCVYCGYGNGLIEYVREISARTEQYWCPIKHAIRTLDPHVRSQQFFHYGDAEAYRQGLEALRKDWKEQTVTETENK